MDNGSGIVAPLTPKQKALRINLDEKHYGSFSEIGAGQETSRYFFQAGAASQGLAKSLSAYSMEFSDAIYGKEPGKRYVTEARLRKMLRHETNLLENRLKSSPHEDRSYFAYANTVTTINYNKTNKGHGWVGVSFQTNKNEKYNEITLHLRFNENSATLQQSTLGKLGVNLVYGALYLHKEPRELLKSLYHYIDKDDIEIDAINFTGPCFDKVDNRIMSLQLVKEGMTEGIIFGPNCKSLMPADLLYKKDIFAFRGTFRPISNLSIDILEKGLETFKKNQPVEDDKLEVIFEISLKNLRKTTGSISEQDFLDRADAIGKMGYNVLVSNFREYYAFVDYLSRYTKRNIGLPVGVSHLKAIFDEKYYEHLEGGILESFGKLFRRNTNIYLYPLIGQESGEIITTENIILDLKLKDLYKYFKKNQRIIDIKGFSDEIVSIDIYGLANEIKNDTEYWRTVVPEPVIELIQERNLFGYNPKQTVEITSED